MISLKVQSTFDKVASLDDSWIPSRKVGSLDFLGFTTSVTSILSNVDHFWDGAISDIKRIQVG